jgi:hypothetical protein
MGYDYLKLENRNTIKLPTLKVNENHDFLQSGNCYLLPVAWDSPKAWRLAVERFGYYIKRENGYDFAMYEAESFSQPKYKAYLLFHPFGSHNHQPCGVVFLEWCEGEWWLMWAWIHPYYRGCRNGGDKSLLTEAWPYFKEKYGDFKLLTPISPAMKGFLRKVEHQNAEPKS